MSSSSAAIVRRVLNHDNSSLLSKDIGLYQPSSSSSNSLIEEDCCFSHPSVSDGSNASPVATTINPPVYGNSNNSYNKKINGNKNNRHGNSHRSSRTSVVFNYHREDSNNLIAVQSSLPRNGKRASSVCISNPDNIHVYARFRPLNKVEEEINAHLANGGLRDEVFDCVLYPKNNVVEIRVPDGILLAVEQQTNSMSTGAKDIDSFVNVALGINSPMNMSITSGSSTLTTSNTAMSAYSTGVVSNYHFTFSRVLNQMSTQEEIYCEIGAPIVADILQGYNGTILAYGQTGSGKTYTMMGAPRTAASTHLSSRMPLANMGPIGISGSSNNLKGGRVSLMPFNPAGAHGGIGHPYRQGYIGDQHGAQSTVFELHDEFGGIIPRAINDLFQRMYASPVTTTFSVQMYFVEIYMEKVRDLLSNDPAVLTNLNVREDSKTNSFYIEGCVTPDVSSPDDILELLEYGLTNRVTASTKMNVASSRSHCLLCITVKIHDSVKHEHRTGKLFLVDLAGSEKVAKTKSEGQQLEEAKLINKSLTTLGHVIKNLSDLSGSVTHVPYRDSKLTKILQDALGGNSRTSLIVCCSPSVRNAHETLSTLRFGQRAKHIRNKAVVNKEYTVDELKTLLDEARNEIDTLRRSSNVVAPQVISSKADLHFQQEEAKHLEEKRTLIANIHALEDEMRDVKEAHNTNDILERMIAQLRAEIIVWEQEYSSLAREYRAVSKQAADAKEQAERDRSQVEELIGVLSDRKGEVGLLRVVLQDALCAVRQDIEMFEINKEITFPPKKSMEDASTTTQPVITEPVITAATHTAVLNRLALVERQQQDLETSLADLRNENGSLNLELQLLTKKLIIRNERITNLKNGLQLEQKATKTRNVDHYQECAQLRDCVSESRADSEHWRLKFEALALQLGISVVDENCSDIRLITNGLPAALKPGLEGRGAHYIDRGGIIGPLIQRGGESPFTRDTSERPSKHINRRVNNNNNSDDTTASKESRTGRCGALLSPPPLAINEDAVPAEYQTLLEESKSNNNNNNNNTPDDINNNSITLKYTESITRLIDVESPWVDTRHTADTSSSSSSSCCCEDDSAFY